MSQKSIVASFNYLILSLALKYVDNQVEYSTKEDKNFIDKINQFNNENDFSNQKVSLFPFLLTIANGKKTVLLEHFTDYPNDFYFMTNNYGIVNKGLTDLINSNNSNLIFNSGRFTTKIKTSSITFNSLNEYKSQLITRFNDGNLEKILESIDYSIKFLHEFRIPNFANKSFLSLSFWSSNTLAYRIYSTNENKQSWNAKEVEGFSETVNTETYNLGAINL